MARLSKNCVQRVVGDRYKTVGTYPQIPHSRWITFWPDRVIPRLTHRSSMLPTVLSHQFPTGKNPKLTDTGSGLYPLSTLPITTTITYI